MLQELWQGLSRLVYPPHCLLCRTYLPYSPVPGVCLRCQAAIVLNRPPFCCKCSRHLGTSAVNICRECRKTKPAFDFAWSACLYEDPLKNLIHHFKYGQKTLLRRFLGSLIISFLKVYGFDMVQFDLIVPIPLSATRLRERGYNQARLLAQEIGREFSLPLAENLRRIRHTHPQTMLNEKQRWTNINGAFTIKQPQTLRHKNILIIDDLLTTGATASEAARVLKEAGAKTVGVLTLAITKEHA